MELTLEGKKQIMHKRTPRHTKKINEHTQIHKLHTLLKT